MPKGKNVEMKEKIKVSHHLRSYINVTFAPIYVFMDDKNKHNDDENVRNFGMHIDPLVGLFSITFYSDNCFILNTRLFLSTFFSE